jgi:hypothetical protein
VRDVYTHAMELFDRGFMPIPLRMIEGQRKKPVFPWRQYQATRPERSVVEAWFQGQDVNVGIVTGKVSGIVVVDLDGKMNDPREWLAAHGFNIKTPMVSTGRGGAHVYYRHPGGTVANGVKLSQIDGVSIDIRADGGYVVAPPSVHDTGVLYEWLIGPSVEPAIYPPALAALFNRATEHGTIKVSEFLDNDMMSLMAPAVQGGRNHHAARLAGFWLKVTKDDAEASWAALNLWNNQNEPPLPTAELRQTFESIVRRRQTAEVIADETPDAADTDPLPLMSGAEWAEAVRNMPPRQGVRADAIPGLYEIGGLVPRDLLVLAGRPGMGKSTCAWNLVAEVSLAPIAMPTVIFSTEMTANDVARWMAAKIYEKDSRDLTPEEWNAVLDRISRSPITICDAGAVTADQIHEIVTRRPETKLVIVDHIQRVVGRDMKGDNRNLEVGRTAQTLKSLAKDGSCTVLALSQMNRASDALGRPKLSSLRDSGEIEQEADAVIFLWTQEEDLTQPELPVEFYLAKNRHGALAQIECTFKKARKVFTPSPGSSILARVEREIRYKEQVRKGLEEG